MKQRIQAQALSKECLLLEQLAETMRGGTQARRVSGRTKTDTAMQWISMQETITTNGGPRRSVKSVSREPRTSRGLGTDRGLSPPDRKDTE